MGFRCSHRKGFTLLEILIVVATLAVLAGAVIPHFEHAIEDAKQSTMLENQHELNLAVQRYRAEHGGSLPSSSRRLTSRTNYSGALVDNGAFGPYVLAIPLNPLNNSRTMVRANLGTVDLSEFTGWVCDTSTGEIAGGLNTSAGGGKGIGTVFDK